MAESSDAVVAGAGVVGAPTAFHLARWAGGLARPPGGSRFAPPGFADMALITVRNYLRRPAGMIGDYSTMTVRGLPISPTWKTRNFAPFVELMLLATMFRSGISCTTSPGSMTCAGAPSTSILIEPSST